MKLYVAERILRLLGWFMICFGFSLVVVLRIQGIHLTEGELLLEYWMYWLISAVFIVMGGVFTLKGMGSFE